MRQVTNVNLSHRWSVWTVVDVERGAESSGCDATQPVSKSRPATWAARHWVHLVILAWGCVCALVYGRHGGQSWHFLVDGARSLTCAPVHRWWLPCGLHVYAEHPDVQVGPVSLLVAAALVLPRGAADGFDVARVAMALVGFLVLLLVERGALVDDARGRRLRGRRLLLAGLAFAPAWCDLAVGFGHLDDVLALVFTAAAVDAVVHGRARAAGWFLALAVLSKPWAVAFLPLVLALPRERWAAALTRALGPVVGAVALFVLADPTTARAAAFKIPNAPASSLRVLGVADATPPWDRPVQVGLGWALGAAAVVLGRWRAVIMIAAACRIMLDPQVYSYYTAGLLMGTVIWDVQVRVGRTIPLWTWSTFAALFASRYLPLGPATLGVLRLGICLTVITACLGAPGLLGRIGHALRRSA